MRNQLSNSGFHPVSKNERIQLLDMLRGFALLGVLLNNIYDFSGYTWLSPEEAKGALFIAADDWIYITVKILVDTKFITIFSILFGVGFSIQLERAKQKGIAFKSYFIKRMLIMLLIACIHAYLFWCGDIIRYYAVFGIVLIFISHWSTKTLLRVGIAFSIFISAAVFIFHSIIQFEYVPGNPLGLNQPEQIINVFGNGGYLEVLKMNWSIDPVHNFLKDSSLRISFIFGRMLLGFWMGRIALFSNPEKYGKMLKNWFWYGLTLGTLGSGGYWMVTNEIIELDSLWLLWLPFAVVAGLILHSLFYISAIIKLYNSPRFKKLLLAFVPIGKMAFSNYIFQTIICMFIFYGFFPGLNLMAQVGPTLLLFMGLAIFLIQYMLSNWWLKNHDFGPIEKFWRKWSYSNVSKNK